MRTFDALDRPAGRRRTARAEGTAEFPLNRIVL